MITIEQAVALLQEHDHYQILIHAYPDGDTIGSGYALCYALRKMGKQANVVCAHPIPNGYSYITKPYTPMDFEPKTYVSTDVASLSLLGPGYEQYQDAILLAIDHHGTHGNFAKYSLVDATAAANTELILELLDAMNISIDPYLAQCIYTGVSTDTGCFKHTNTTSQCHRIAARMMDAGADIETINQIMFDTKSRSRMAIEKSILESLEFYFHDQIAFITVTKQMRIEAGVADGDLEGITSIPRQVEGVLIGATIRENDDGEYKVSLRSRSGLNVATICAQFGGGGHPCAAGCHFTCSLQEVKDQLLTACQSMLENRE